MKSAGSTRKKSSGGWALMLPLGALLGCHSAFVSATVDNQTGGPVSLVEVDYPSASFGTESLGSGASYPYRFKILGSGASKVSWTDAAHHEQTSNGPHLQEGQEGSLRIQLTPHGATWTTALKP